MNTHARSLCIVTVPLALITASLLYAGPLNPPAGPITSTGKTTQEIFDKVGSSEPRIPISAATTPGDADSVFKITQPGSYYLTANLTGVAGKNGIEVTANDVTIDLNGFELLGVAGSLNGIIAGTTTVTHTGTTILNGTARSWGGIGFNTGLSNGVTLRNVKAFNNGTYGIYAPGSTNVIGCVANSNAAGGMVVSGAVTHCTASENTGFGFDVGGNTSHCTAYQNSGTGFAIAGGSISECEVRFNGMYGIDADLNCVVLDNLVAYSGLDNIRVDSRCTVRGNNCSLSGNAAVDGAGIHATGVDNRIENNNCVFGDRGIKVDGPGNIILRNTCSGNATNWVLAANNVFGPIVDRTAPASAAVSGNSATSSLGSTDANANFSY